MSDRKISEEARQAIIEAHHEAVRAGKIPLPERVIERAEEILSKPKFSPLVEKVVVNLKAALPDALMSYDSIVRDAVAKALDGVVECTYRGPCHLRREGK